MKNELTIPINPNYSKPRQCPGCGQKAQIVNEGSICQRCWRMLHYNDFKSITNPLSEELILAKINKIAQGVLIVIDLFNFNMASLNELINNIDPHIKKILLINKIDLCDQNIRISKVIDKMSAQLEQVNNLVIIAISSLKKDRHLNQLFNLIQQFKKGDKIISVGYENAGKTTLVSALLTHNNVDHHLIQSRFPGTTHNFISFEIEGIKIIDTPGLSNPFSMRQYAQDVSHKKWTFKSRFRPKIFSLNADQSILFGNLVIFSFSDGPITNFTIYPNPNINVMRTKTTNWDRLQTKDDAFFKWPIAKNRNYVEQIIHLEKNNDKIEIEIIDIGIIKLTSNGQTLKFLGPINTIVKIRKSIF